MARYHLLGGAVATTTTGSVAASGAVSITIADASGWPDASSGRVFPVVIDEGAPTEEKVLVTARAGTTLTVTSGNRGHDGTVAQAHNTGATIRPTITATLLDKFDLHVETTTNHLGAGTISSATYFAAGVVDAAAIATDAVGSAEIVAAAVGTAELATNAVTTVKIADANVTTAKILDANVTTAKIADANITTAKILDANVTTAKIADASVTQAKVATGFALHAYSSAAPASPVRGQTWLDIDTMEFWTYYGATTGWQKPWNVAWGLLGYAQATTQQTGITTAADLTGITVTFTAVANRRVRVEAFAPMFSSVGGDACGLFIANSGGTALAGGHVHSATNVIAYANTATLIVSPSAGSTTYKARAQRGAGSGNVSVGDGITPFYIAVFDEGPNGSAPVA